MVIKVGPSPPADLAAFLQPYASLVSRGQSRHAMERYTPTFPIWLNIPLSKSSVFFKPLSICETLAVGMAIITP